MSTTSAHAMPRAAAALVACIGLVAAVTGCSSKHASSQPASAGTGPIRVCSDARYRPMEYAGPGPRGLAYTGFDIELLDAMAQSLHRPLAVRDVPFDQTFRDLSAGRCDVVASSVTITGARAAAYAFTTPYFDADQSLLVKRTSRIRRLARMVGRKIGVQARSVGQRYVAAHAPRGATVVDFADATGVFAALDAGTIDGIVQDLPANAGRATEDKTVEVVQTFPTGERFGFVVTQKQAALRADLDRALRNVRADGTYQVLYRKYFQPR